MAEPLHDSDVNRRRDIEPRKRITQNGKCAESGRFGVTGDAKSGQLPRTGALP